ncbi:hypothetical protein GCM10022396_19830 [Flavivirga amylovorans]
MSSSVVNAQDPNGPTGLATTDGTPNQFTLTWDDDPLATGGFNIFIIEGSSGDVYVETVPAGSTSYIYTGTYGSVTVTDGGTYIAKIQALPDGDFNAYADITTTVNATPPMDPDAPTGLALSYNNPNEFTLTWDDDPNATNGFNIFIVQGASGDQYITTVPAGTTSYIYSGVYGSVTVADGNVYTAKIQALPDSDFNAYAELETKTLSNNDVDGVQFSVSPNPANEVVNIQASAKTLNDISKISIYSLTGQLVKESNTFEIEVDHLSSGLYVLSVQDENGNTTTKKFVKN